MEQYIAGGIGLFATVLVILTVLLPVLAYSAQRYARLCYEELKKLNAR